MERRVALELLALEPGDPFTRDRVRRAYLRRLRVHPPERDPEGFRRLREAFEMLETEVRIDELMAAVEQDPLFAEGPPPGLLDDPPAPAGPTDALEARPGHVAEPRPADARHEPSSPAPDEPPSDVRDQPSTLSEVTDEILALVERGQLGAALELRDRWNRSTLDDHREVSAYVAGRWALTRELLEVAVAVPASLRSAIAHGIAHDSLWSAHDAVQLVVAVNPPRARDLRKHLAKRAPNLHQVLGTWMYEHEQRCADADGHATKSPRWASWATWFAVLVVLKLVAGAVSCEERSSSRDRSHLPSPPVEVPDWARERFQDALDDHRARRTSLGLPQIPETPDPGSQSGRSPQGAPPSSSP